MAQTPSSPCAARNSADALRTSGSADVLVHVESFEKGAIEKTWLSFSTKLTSYLSAAKPILVCGPPALASCDMVAGSGCGICVSEDSVEAISAAVRSLCTDAELRARLGERSWRAARSVVRRV